mmetsp:Transcript_745/g.1150  ORF Transcript_745/g.1150 Transcript_745/m.1150 type:complete len:408 (+) Transcript_745:1234-2457(+)|eukprot:CAMPEP_0117421872 /NCGR_PEP_ID=MMETSP0758-20121206/2835_1 /TAXON_ID=63605 /ORGANISM="Percolomonas cosmopolitus, Strain AE-1 (ATCC 50343)" /LENGTH=407 /DNA_ID=CAMNT_0005204173 /DNA_START=142 /DNA_END=1368 /DNA_ORIENTATION=-
MGKKGTLKANTRELMQHKPVTSGSMHVHKGDAYQLLMEGITPADVNGTHNFDETQQSFNMEDTFNQHDNGSPLNHSNFLVLHEAVGTPTKRGSQTRRSKKKSNVQDQIDNARNRREERYQQKCKELEQETRRLLSEQKRVDEVKFAKKYNRLMKEREDFLPQIDKLIHHHDEEYLFGLASLHEDWHKKVFNPIQEQINENVNSRPIEEIRARHRQMYDAYLKADGAKESGVFRDVIIEEEYNPLESHAHSVRYKKPKAKDNPQRHAQTKRRKEFKERTMIASRDEVEVMKAKELKNCSRQDMMPIEQYRFAEDTPAGRYSHQNKKTYRAPTDRKTKSRVPISQYDMVKGANANKLVEKEWGPGKRTFGTKQLGKSLVQLTEGFENAQSKAGGKRVAGYQGQLSTLKV